MSVSNRRVHVVAGDQQRGTMLNEWLSHCFETDVSTSGGEALLGVEDGTDVVVVSEELPDVSVWEFTEGLRADGRECRLVLLSHGESDPDCKDEAFDRVLEWPLNPESLRGAVDEAADAPDPESVQPGPTAA